MARRKFTLSTENEDVVENIHEEVTPEEEGELAGIDQELDDAEEELAELEEEEENVEAAMDKIEEQEEINEQIEEERPTEIKPEDVNASVASYLEACGMMGDSPYGRKYNSELGYYTVSPISVESMYLSPIHAFTQSREQNKNIFRRALDKIIEIIKAIARGICKLLRILHKKDGDHIKSFKDILKRAENYGTREKLNLEAAMALQPLWLYLSIMQGKMNGKDLIEYLSVDIFECVTQNKKPGEQACDIIKANDKFMHWKEDKRAEKTKTNNLLLHSSGVGYGVHKKGFFSWLKSFFCVNYTLRGKLTDAGAISKKFREFNEKFDVKNLDDNKELTQIPDDFGKFDPQAGFCAYKNKVYIMFNSSKLEDFFLVEHPIATPMNLRKQESFKGKYSVGKLQNDTTFNGTGMRDDKDPAPDRPGDGELLVATQYIDVLDTLSWDILNKSNFEAEVNGIIKAISSTTHVMRKFEDRMNKYVKESDAMFSKEPDADGLGEIRSAVSGANKTIKACLQQVPVVRNYAIGDLKTALAKQLINHGNR